MKSTFRILSAAAAVWLAASCSSHTSISGEYATYDFPTECIGTSSEGHHIVRAWGRGISKKEALENARANALSSVLFSGVHAGKNSCSQRPLLPQANARETHSAYFNAFFSKGGDYTLFATISDEGAKIKSQNPSVQTWSTVIEIKTDELRHRLKHDGIITTP